jgi:sugar-specific transcriptional regulator TrmB
MLRSAVPPAMLPRMQALARLGIQGYAAKAYVALSGMPDATAKEVSQRAGVPKGRVYEVLEELHGNGAVEVLPESPRRYRAVPFHDLFEQRLAARDAEVGQLRKEREALFAAFGPSAAGGARATNGVVAVLRDPHALEARAAAMLARAREDVLIAGTPLAAERLLRVHDQVLTAKKGVAWRLMMPVTASNRTEVERLAGLDVEVRHFPGFGHVAVGVGDEAASTIVRRPPQGEPLGVFLEDAALAGAMRIMLEHCWTGSQPLDERVRTLAK